MKDRVSSGRPKVTRSTVGRYAGFVLIRVNPCKSVAPSFFTATLKLRTDWKRVDAREDDQIDFSGTPELTPEMFAGAIAPRGLKPLPRKAQLTLRVDRDALEWYKTQGAGYQTRINTLLRAYMQEHHRKSA